MQLLKKELNFSHISVIVFQVITNNFDSHIFLQEMLFNLFHIYSSFRHG